MKLEFDEKTVRELLTKEFSKLDENVSRVELLAKELGISSLKIDVIREREWLINKLFPYAYYSDVRARNNHDLIGSLVKDLRVAFENRYERALRNMGFRSVNYKRKTIKCYAPYGLSIYQLRKIGSFSSNLMVDEESIKIVKKYANGNVEFQFLKDSDYEEFLKIVLYNNPKTTYVLENASEELKAKYKKGKKVKHFNYHSIIYEFLMDKGFSNSEPVNYHLIDKEWNI